MANAMQGIIAIWSGDSGDIPFGWKLCDGNNGTPDLRDRFVIGSGPTYPKGDIGGDVQHLHYFTEGPHNHIIPAGSDIAAGSDFSATPAPHTVLGNTNYRNKLPPYYSLCYIMHI